SAVELSDFSVSLVEAHSGTSKFDLWLSLEEGPAAINGVIEYNTDVFEAATIGRMLAHFQTLLESIIADPDRSIADMPLLPQPERRQVLVEWNATAVDYPRGERLHQLI